MLSKLPPEILICIVKYLEPITVFELFPSYFLKYHPQILNIDKLFQNLVICNCIRDENPLLSLISLDEFLKCSEHSQEVLTKAFKNKSQIVSREYTKKIEKPINRIRIPEQGDVLKGIKIYGENISDIKIDVPSFDKLALPFNLIEGKESIKLELTYPLIICNMFCLNLEFIGNIKEITYTYYMLQTDDRRKLSKFNNFIFTSNDKQVLLLHYASCMVGISFMARYIS